MATYSRSQAGVDMDWRTGAIISGWPTVIQSLEMIFTTYFGSRVQREYFGSFVPIILGREIITEKSTLKFWTAIWTAVDRFEPRYTDLTVLPTRVTRGGELGFQIEGKYRPRALQGDYEPEGLRRVLFTLNRQGDFIRLEAV